MFQGFSNLEAMHVSAFDGDLIFVAADCTTLPVNSLSAKVSPCEACTVLDLYIFATLHGIQILHLEVATWENEVEYFVACLEYIHAITSTLLDLRELVFYATLDPCCATDFNHCVGWNC